MVVLVSYDIFPNSSPGAIRNCSFAQAIKGLGSKICVFHPGLINKEIEIEQKSLFTKNRLSRYFFFGFRVINELYRLYVKDHLDTVIIYSSVGLFSSWLIRNWCIRHRIIIVFDVVEWYSKEQFKNGIFSLRYQLNNICNTRLINNKCRVITISSFLQTYFSNKGCKTYLIPIICKSSEIVSPCDLKLNEKRSFIYAGSHFEMDNISLILRAIASLSDYDREKMVFHLFGFSESFIREQLGDDLVDQIKGTLCIHGRQDNNTVLNYLNDCDFSVVMRDPTYRVNKAGFPSKVIESMKHGVAFFGTYSSDLYQYLFDGENSIIVENLNVEIISKGFNRIINLPDDEIIRIRTKSVDTVKSHFTFESYKEVFADLLG